MRALTSLGIPEKLVQLKRPRVGGRWASISGRSHLSEVDTNWYQLPGGDTAFLLFAFCPVQCHRGLALLCPCPWENQSKERTVPRTMRLVSPGRRGEGTLQRSTFSSCLTSTVGWAFLGTRRSDEFGSGCPVVNREERHTCTRLLPPKPHCLAKYWVRSAVHVGMDRVLQETRVRQKLSLGRKSCARGEWGSCSSWSFWPVVVLLLASSLG